MKNKHHLKNQEKDFSKLSPAVQAIAKSLKEKWLTPEYQANLKRRVEERKELMSEMGPYGAGDERIF